MFLEIVNESAVVNQNFRWKIKRRCRGKRIQRVTCLRESKPDGISSRLLRCFLYRLRQRAGTAEICANSDLRLRLDFRKIRSVINGLPHLAENRHPIRPPERGAAAEEGERIVLRSNVVDNDVPQHIFTDLLGKVDVDPEEVVVHLGGLDRLKQGLEPTERRSVPTYPEKFHALQRANITILSSVPDVFQDGREGGDANTSTNKDGNLVARERLRR